MAVLQIVLCVTPPVEFCVLEWPLSHDMPSLEKGQKSVRKASEKREKSVRKASEKSQKRVRKASEKRQKKVRKSVRKA